MQKQGNPQSPFASDDRSDLTDRELVGAKIERFDTEIYDDYARLYREHPSTLPRPMLSAGCVN